MSVTTKSKTEKSYRHLTLNERVQIEAYRRQGLGINEIARELGRSKSTISEEVKRGTVHQVWGDEEVYVYHAITAQDKYEKARKKSVCKSFDEKYSAEFFKQLEVALKAEPRVHSVDTFVNYYKQAYPNERVPSTKVVYRLIHDGKLAIKSSDLPNKANISSKITKHETPKKSNDDILGATIQQHPKHIEGHEHANHYESQTW